MGRRNIKRVDYSKFSISGASSESDDDFQESPNPPLVKSTKASKTKTKNNKAESKETRTSKRSVDHDGNSDVKKRRTRTSNAEELCEQDILTAIDISRSECSESSESTTVIEKVNQNNEVIDICDSDDGDDDVNLITKTKKRNSKQCLLEESDGESVDEYSIQDTIPLPHAIGDANDDVEKDMLIDKKKTEKTESRSPLKEQQKNTTNNDSNKRNDRHASKINKTIKSHDKQTMNSQVAADASKSTSAPPIRKTPTISSPRNSPCIQTNKIVTPGRLRLGLSRNVRISKPLHPKISPKVE